MEKVAKEHCFILRRSMRRDKWYLFTLLPLSTCLCLNASVDSLYTSELSQKFFKTLTVRCQVSESATEHLVCVRNAERQRNTCDYFSAAWFPDRQMIKTTQTPVPCTADIYFLCLVSECLQPVHEALSLAHLILTWFCLGPNQYSRPGS